MDSHAGLRVLTFVEPDFGENSYVIWPADDRRVAGGTAGPPPAWIIDPGLPPQAAQIQAAVARERLGPAAIVLTHGHADHLGGVGELRAAWPELAIWAPRDEAHMLGDAQANLSGPFGFPVVAPAATRLLEAGERLDLNGHTCTALDVGGHSPGGLAYYFRMAGIVFTGDALFAGSIGRYDLPGGDGARLLANIRAHLMTLPDATVVYSGHGPATTIGDERRRNPYLQADFEP